MSDTDEKNVLFNPKYLRENYPFVLSFNNIVDFIRWENPIIKTGEREVRKAKKVWRTLLRTFSKNGWYTNSIDTPTFILGGLYNTDDWDYQILSDSPVMIPFKPKYMYMIANDKIYTLRLSSKSLYVNVLKQLVKAVIVKT